MYPSVANGEAERLAALRRLEIMDTEPEEVFNRITCLSARLFAMPLALITLVDADRQWFKSCSGLNTMQAEHLIGFCSHAVHSGKFLVVPDNHLDERFQNNPLVVGEPHIRFYAGAPLVTSDGFALGTLCIIGYEPRQFSEEDRANLEDLAAITAYQMELRLSERRCSKAEAALKLAHRQLEAHVDERTRQLVRTDNALETEVGEHQRSQRMLELVLDNIPQAIFWKDRDSLYLGCNRIGAAAAGVGLPRHIIGKTDYDLAWRSEQAQSYRLSDRQVIDSGSASYHIIETQTQATGRDAWIDTSRVPLRDEAGEVVGVLVTCEDITERRQTQRNLLAAQEEAERSHELEEQISEHERLDQLKDDFLSTVSHELRTPMASIRLAIYMLEHKPQQYKEYLHILKAECKRETKLINDLLDFQRLEAGFVEIQPEIIAFADWLPPLIEPFYAIVSQREQHLDCRLEADLPPIFSDRNCLERIVSELVNNACKYTVAGKAIAVEVGRSSDSTVLITVRNACPDIPAPELLRIFEKFHRIAGSDPERHGGTGLGLAIVRKLVERLGGTISVTSSGGQTAFVVRLPQVLSGRRRSS